MKVATAATAQRGSPIGVSTAGSAVRLALLLSTGSFAAPALASTAPAISASVAPISVALATAPAPAPAEALRVLSAADALRYGQAFAAMNRGDLIAGQTLTHGLVNPCLLGRLEAARLLNPDYRANYAELASWMERNADLPEAQRVYELALKRKPSSATALHAPAAGDGQNGDGQIRDGQTSAVGLAERVSRSLQGTAPPADARQRAARDAFYAGDIDRAYDLGARSGERWITGLSAMRLKRYGDAVVNFQALSGDLRQSPWLRSGAAYWGSRAATAAGDTTKADSLLKVAARSPDTFYGLIASRELERQHDRSAPPADAIGDLVAASDLDPSAVADFAHQDPRGQRAAALMQIGLPLQAGEELRSALARASDADRPRLTSLALALNAPIGGPNAAQAGWARFDLGHFPTPVLAPAGGFVIDKALVYALVRQESRFNPNAASSSGAYGLMQLTAETAARLAGDASLRHNPSALRDPALNLKLGQAYVAKLLDGVKGDVVRAVAAYNSGPGVVQKLAARMGADADSLMLVESIPSSQTRDYVQRVMAYYWIYKQIFGQDSASLNAVAAGQRALATHF